jgi:hypothetical protein
MGIFRVLIWKAASMWIGRVWKGYGTVTRMVREGYDGLNNS